MSSYRAEIKALVKGQIKSYKIDNATFSSLQQDDVIKGNDLVLLVHGFTKANETVTLLDFHSRMTPEITVLMLDYRYDLNTNYSTLFQQWLYGIRYMAASKFASNFSLSNFLTNFKDFSISCIGHSLGAHVCGSICRKSRCDRIVALDPAGPLWSSKFGFKCSSVSRNDAKYVVFLMTTTEYGLHDHSLPHEFIMANINGSIISECPPVGKFNTTLCATNTNRERICVDWSIGAGGEASCAHTMVVIIFAQTLDISSSLTLVDTANNIVSGWNGYTMTPDKRVATAGVRYSTNETAYIPQELLSVTLASNESELQSSVGNLVRINNSNTWVRFIDNNTVIDDIEIFSEAKIKYARISRSRLSAMIKWGFAEYYMESKSCYKISTLKQKCHFSELYRTYIQRDTLVSTNLPCMGFLPSSQFHTYSNYSVFTTFGKSVKLQVNNSSRVEYILENSNPVYYYHTPCNTSSAVSFKGSKLSVKYNDQGIHTIDIVYANSVTHYTIIVGSPTFTFPTKIIIGGSSAFMTVGIKSCLSATWYWNGVYAGVGCAKRAVKEGYYKYVIRYKDYTITGDFIYTH